MRRYWTGFVWFGWIPAEDGKGRWMVFGRESEYIQKYLAVTGKKKKKRQKGR